MELFEQFRKDRRVEGASIRELADRHHVHWRTVRQALESAVPPPRGPYEQRRRPGLKVPRCIEFLGALPLYAAGKVMKDQLRWSGPARG